MDVAKRLEELGITLPPAQKPAGAYVGCSLVGNVLYVSGHGPSRGDSFVRGKVGHDRTLDEGKEAARLTGLSILATIDDAVGLDRVRRIVKTLGMVNTAPEFNNTPAIIDGCSNLFIDIWGEAGRGARSAVGMAALPFDIAVEIELVAEVD
jgi:enamine deaminase RidA (YjgF/YER057c/UK114 family)